MATYKDGIRVFAWKFNKSEDPDVTDDEWTCENCSIQVCQDGTFWPEVWVEESQTMLFLTPESIKSLCESKDRCALYMLDKTMIVK